MRIAICLFIASCMFLVGCKQGNPLASFMSRAPSCAVADELLYQIDGINEDVGMRLAFQTGLQALPDNVRTDVVSRINAKVASDGARMRAQGDVREWIALLLLSTKSEARVVDNYRYCNGDFDLGNGQNLHWVYSVTKGENGPELRINKAEVTGTAVAMTPSTSEVPAAGADDCSAMAQVAVDFMNLYVRHLNDEMESAADSEMTFEQATYNWLRSNPLADPSLASAFTATEAQGGDPIIDGQDYPSKFRFLRCTGEPGIVLVNGVDWDMVVPVKVAQTPQGLKVVGSGCVNTNVSCGRGEPSAAAEDYYGVDCGGYSGAKQSACEAWQNTHTQEMQRRAAAEYAADAAVDSAVPNAADASVASPSFPCPGSSGADPARRYSATELAICGNAALAALDVRMAEAYRAAKSRAADGQGLKKDQLRWLAGLSACASNVACLSRAYEVRIAQLTGS